MQYELRNLALLLSSLEVPRSIINAAATGDKLVFMHESLHTHAAEAADGRVPPARREVGLRLGLGQV